jgi:probable rRNA maturation factor
MAKSLDLQIVGDVPESLDLAPIEAMMAVLVSRTEAMGLPEGEVNLTLVDDQTIRELNRDYSGNDYATDVLSFNYLESGGPIEDVIGEMAISLETAARQAEEAKMSLSEEVALLALHGILHIVGLDHQTPDEQQELQELQKAIMTEANLTYREFSWQE